MPLANFLPFGVIGPQVVQSVLVDTIADLTTTSTTFVDLTGTSVTLTTTGGICVCTFSASGSNATANTNVRFQLMIDGVAQRGTKFRQDVATATGGPASLVYRAVLAAGSHTFKMQWSVSAGTGRIRTVTVLEEHASLLIEELYV